MFESSRAKVIRAFTERITILDLDGAYELVTDDFLYKTAHATTGLELGSLDYVNGVFDKVGLREYLARLAKELSNFQVSLSLPHFKPCLTVADL